MNRIFLTSHFLFLQSALTKMAEFEELPMRQDNCATSEPDEYFKPNPQETENACSPKDFEAEQGIYI